MFLHSGYGGVCVDCVWFCRVQCIWGAGLCWRALCGLRCILAWNVWIGSGGDLLCVVGSHPQWLLPLTSNCAWATWVLLYAVVPCSIHQHTVPRCTLIIVHNVDVRLQESTCMVCCFFVSRLYCFTSVVSPLLCCHCSTLKPYCLRSEAYQINAGMLLQAMTFQIPIVLRAAIRVLCWQTDRG